MQDWKHLMTSQNCMKQDRRQETKSTSLKQSLHSLKVLRTDFYEIIPLPDSYVIVIGDVVVGANTFSSIEEAEDYVIWNYENLRAGLYHETTT